jgi:hypothetical protein
MNEKRGASTLRDVVAETRRADQIIEEVFRRPKDDTEPPKQRGRKNWSWNSPMRNSTRF